MAPTGRCVTLAGMWMTQQLSVTTLAIPHNITVCATNVLLWKKLYFLFCKIQYLKPLPEQPLDCQMKLQYSRI